MAITIHVASAPVDAETLAGALGDTEGIELSSADGWTTAAAAVWAVDGERFDRALASLSVPSLRATTEGGERAYVGLVRPGGAPAWFPLEYALLELAEAPLDAEALDAIVGAYRLRGCAPPESDVASWRDGAYAEALRDWQVERLLAALADHGLPAGDAVRAVLTGEALGPDELAGDLGHLPRLMCALGPSAPFREWMALHLDEAPFDAAEHAADVRALVVGLESAPLDRPVSTPAGAGLAAALRVAAFCDEAVDATVSSDAALADPGDWAALIDPDASPRCLALALPTLMLLRERRADLVALVDALPDGASLELACAGEDSPAGRLVFGGAIAGGQWRIERAAPPLRADDLEAALALARALDEGGPLVAADDSEAAAALRDLEDGGLLGDEPVVRDGLTLGGDGWQREPVARALFRRRLRGVFDVEDAERRERESVRLLRAAQAGEDETSQASGESDA